MSGAIDTYLDRLLLELRGSARDVRRILAEAEEHLRDAAAEGVADGMSEEDAERSAVDRFGSSRLVARRFGGFGLLSSALVRVMMRAGAPLVATGLIAIGVSGLIAEVLGRVFGAAFVAGDLPFERYTPQRCAEFQEYFPGRDCLQAAALHHWGEVVVYRVAVGVLGLILLGGLLLLRRRRRAAEIILPPGMFPAVAAALYGVAAAVLLLEGVGSIAAGGMAAGAGQWLSAGAVASVTAIAYGLMLIRSLGGLRRMESTT